MSIELYFGFLLCLACIVLLLAGVGLFTDGKYNTATTLMLGIMSFLFANIFIGAGGYIVWFIYHTLKYLVS